MNVTTEQGTHDVLPANKAINGQCERLLAYLQKYGSIRPLEAITELGIYRVADPAHRLRKRGYDVRTTMVRGVNRFNEEVRFAEYSLGTGTPAEEQH